MKANKTIRAHQSNPFYPCSIIDSTRIKQIERMKTDKAIRAHQSNPFYLCSIIDSTRIKQIERMKTDKAIRAHQLDPFYPCSIRRQIKNNNKINILWHSYMKTSLNLY
jgi:hypothetical protein